jgi:endonuclease YncB( thermonuclease family)
MLERYKIITLILVAGLIFRNQPGVPDNTAIFESQKARNIYPGTYEVILVRVHDGDTIIVDVPVFPAIIGDNILVRLSHIDTPEMTDKRPEVKTLAIKAREVLKQILHDAKKIELTELKRDKYFRINAIVIADGVNVQTTLINLELAKPYDGGKKSPW